MSRTPPPTGKHGCRGTRKDGKPCGGKPVAGTNVCRLHGGLAPQVQSLGRVRVALREYGIDIPTGVDPVTRMLQLIECRYAWWRWLRDRLLDALDAAAAAGLPESELTDDDRAALARVQGTPPAAPYGMPSDVSALVGQQIDEFGPKSEYVRALAALEAAEWQRCLDASAKAIDKGLAERTVRLAEKQGELLATVVEGLLRDLGHDLRDPKVLGIAQRHLRAVSASDAA